MTMTTVERSPETAPPAKRKNYRTLANEVTEQERRFGRRLRGLRVEAGYGSVEFAAMLNITQPTLWAYENGLTAFAYWRIPAYSRALGRSPTELIQRLFPEPVDELDDQPPKARRGGRKPE